MKLTVSSVINEVADVAITIDGYIPLDIKFIDYEKHPPFYWRVGNGQKSLLELAVLPQNGFLSSITLVMIEPSLIHKKDPLLINLSDNVEGLPVVDTTIWECLGNDDFSQRFIDDFNLGIQTIVSNSSILLIIGEDKKSIKWIKCSEAFYLGIDDEKNIVNLFLKNLTEKEMENFFEAVFI